MKLVKESLNESRHDDDLFIKELSAELYKYIDKTTIDFYNNGESISFIMWIPQEDYNKTDLNLLNNKLGDYYCRTSFNSYKINGFRKVIYYARFGYDI